MTLAATDGEERKNKLIYMDVLQNPALLHEQHLLASSGTVTAQNVLVLWDVKWDFSKKKINVKIYNQKLTFFFQRCRELGVHKPSLNKGGGGAQPKNVLELLH